MGILKKGGGGEKAGEPPMMLQGHVAHSQGHSGKLGEASSFFTILDS